MADTAGFQIVYSGPALDSNEMDVRELAPALLAFADAIEEANKVLNGDRARARLNVHGSFKSGSFGIDLSIGVDFLQELLSVLNSVPVTGALNLINIIGFGATVGGGVIALIRRVANRKIERVQEMDDKRVNFIMEREEIIEATADVVKLYRNIKIRGALEKAIYEPLSRDGIEAVEAIAGGVTTRIEKAERDYFIAPSLEDEPLSETITEAHLQIMSLSFLDDNKWRFARNIGEGVFFADIEDQEFLDKVNRKEITFAKGDILKVRLRTRESVTEKGLRAEYHVDRVLEHRTVARQLTLPMSVGGGVDLTIHDCPPGFSVKGNKSRDGWIYHLPGSASYAATKPEECFATEAEAVAAGYRKAQQ